MRGPIIVRWTMSNACRPTEALITAAISTCVLRMSNQRFALIGQPTNAIDSIATVTVILKSVNLMQILG
jgi:hypothetical protein